MQEFRVFRALGLAFKCWFRNFIPFTLLAALLYSPMLYWVATFDLDDGFFESNHVDPTLGVSALSALVAPLLTYRVIQELNGTRVSMLSSVRHGLRGLLPAIFLAMISGLTELIPLGSILNAILICVWFVAAPAAVAERRGPFSAFARAAELTRGRRLGIFGLVLLVQLIVVPVFFAVGVGVVAGSEDQGEAIFRQLVLVIVLGVAVLQTLTGIVEAVSYALLRQDKDGVSHEQLAGVFE